MKTRPGAEGERRDDVGASPNAAVEVDLGAAFDSLDDRLEGVDGRGHAVELATAVIGDDDRGRAVLDARRASSGARMPLTTSGSGGERAEPGEVRPGQRGIVVEQSRHPGGAARSRRATLPSGPASLTGERSSRTR